MKTPAASLAYRLKRSRLLLMLALILALSALLWGIWHYAKGSSGVEAPNTATPHGKTKDSRPAPTVHVQKSKQEDIDFWRDIPGTVTPLQQVIIRPQVSGQIQALFFNEGQMVQKGQLLAQLDDRSVKATLASLDADIVNAAANLNTTQQTYNRYVPLLKSQAVSQQEVATLKGQILQQQAQLKAAQAKKAASQVEVSNTRIVAPFSGQIGLRKVNVGSQVSPTSADGIATLTQVAPIAVNFGAPSELLTDTQSFIGRTAAIWTLTNPSRELAVGQVSVQDGQIDNTTSTLPVRAIFNNHDRQLIAGQSVRVKLQSQHFNQVVTIPISALKQGLSDYYVFSITLKNDASTQDKPPSNTPSASASNDVTSGAPHENKDLRSKDSRANDSQSKEPRTKKDKVPAVAAITKRIPVTLIAQNDDIAIVEGLEPNVDVIIDGQSKLKEGAPVKVILAKDKTEGPHSHNQAVDPTKKDRATLQESGPSKKDSSHDPKTPPITDLNPPITTAHKHQHGVGA